jgi:sec-independent protein translocase protein TatA
LDFFLIDFIYFKLYFIFEREYSMITLDNCILLFNLGMPEIILIVLVILLFFGASKLPQLGRSIALSIKEFKKAAKDISKEDDSDNMVKSKKVKRKTSAGKAAKTRSSTRKKVREL